MKETISKQINRNILLNPGPTTTSTKVKEALVQPDVCPREEEIGDLLTGINNKLLKVVNGERSHESVLLSCSGTGAVESCLSSCLDSNKQEKVLILINGAYGERMVEICDSLNIPYDTLKFNITQPIFPYKLDQYISENKAVHNYKVVAFIHHETTTGLLNNLSDLNNIIKKHNLISLVDAMSSFAGVPIDVNKTSIDYLITSSNKCLHAIAGIGIVIVSKSELNRISQFKAQSYYFNLYNNFKQQSIKKQFMFTPPVQVLYSLETALDELFQSGGVNSRYEKYSNLYSLLLNGMHDLGFEELIEPQYHSKILTSFKEPNNTNFSFEDMHNYLYQQGITIYPGKSNDFKSFRIANIGELYEDDILLFLKALEQYQSDTN